jgi:RNA polymerase sigma factor (sigma-70 family)
MVVDDGAFTAQIIRCSPRLLAWARRNTSSEADAEDLYQDVVTRAWSARVQVRGADSFEGWLFTIARHEAVDRHRRSDRVCVVQPPENGTFAETVPAPEDEGEPVQLEDVRRIVADLLRRLTAAAATDPSARRLAQYLNTGMEVSFNTEEWARQLGIEEHSLRAERSKFLSWCRNSGVSRADYVGVLIGLSCIGVTASASDSCLDTGAGRNTALIDAFFREMLTRLQERLPELLGTQSPELVKELHELFRSPDANQKRLYRVRVENELEEMILISAFWMRETPQPEFYALLMFVVFAFSATEGKPFLYNYFRSAWDTFRRTVPRPSKEEVRSRSTDLADSILGIFDRYLALTEKWLI